MDHQIQAPNMIAVDGSVRFHKCSSRSIVFIYLAFIFVFLFAGTGSSKAQEADTQNISALIEQFRDTDKNIAYEAFQRLVSIGASAVPDLVPLLNDRNAEIRSRTTYALGAIGPAAIEAVPHLIELIRNPDEKEFILQDAAHALRNIGPEAIDELLQAMKSVDNETRFLLMEAIGMMQSSARTVLLNTLKHNDPEIVRFAALVLAGSGYEAEAVVPLLLGIIANKHLDKDIRMLSANFLRKYGEAAVTSSRLLLSVALDRTEHLDVRSSAVLSLGLVNPSPEQVLDPLINLLQSDDENELVRRNTAMALGKIGEPSEEIKSVLMRIVNDRNFPVAVRGGAAHGLGYMPSIDVSAVSELIEMLKDEDSRIRKDAMAALVEISPQSEKADSRLAAKLPFFRQWLNNGSTDQMLMAIVAISHIGPTAASEIPQLLKLMNMKSEPTLRMTAVKAVAYISRGDSEVTKALVKIIRSEKEDLRMRALAITSLSQTGPGAIEALWDLSDHFREEQPMILQKKFLSAIVRAEPKDRALIPVYLEGLQRTNQNEQELAAFFLWVLAKNLQPKIGDLGLSELTQLSDGLRKVRAIFSERESVQKTLDLFGRMDVAYAKELELRKSDSIIMIIAWCYQNKVITGAILYILIMPLLWATILWISPLTILKVNHAITPVKDIKLSGWLGSLNLPVRLLLMVKPFLFHRRVMDAWVNLHADTVLENFSNKQTVKDRAVFVNMPVVLDGSTIASLSADAIGVVFKKQRARLLIWGEGGSGKTSLACQIALWALSDDPSRWISNHRMLPILLEHDLDGDTADEKNVVLNAIRGQMDDLVGRAGSISEEFLKNLLIQRRLLVIVDHLSEMSSETRWLIRPELPDFYANALIITSRIDEELGGVIRSVCKPMRISGNRLSSFMEAYLTQRGVRDRFNDAEFFEGCQKLSAMVRDRQITALMAKLFAEQMIRSKEDGDDADLPATVPDLMLSYLNELYHNATHEELRLVQRDAKIIAWKCLEGHLRPAAADYGDVVRALGNEAVEKRLKIMEHDLRLITVIGAAQDKIRFNLDPLAEHLAAQYLLDHYREDKGFWRSFFERIDAMLNDAEIIEEFIIAVHECWMVRGMGHRFPELTVTLASLKKGGK